jgi:micrococcal nuclease
MKSSKQVTILICCVVVIGVLFFQFINHSGPFANNDSKTSETESTINWYGYA